MYMEPTQIKNGVIVSIDLISHLITTTPFHQQVVSGASFILRVTQV